MKHLLSIIALAAIMCSCQTASQLSTLATPGNVQISVAALGVAASSKLTSLDKTILHKFAVDLLSLTAANVDPDTVGSLIPSLPSSASPFVSPIITTATIELDLALAKFGSHNATVLAYANAVGNGLLAAGF